MFVRVFDKGSGAYYKSMVYGTVGTGWFLRYIVLNPRSRCFELVEYLDKQVTPARPLVEMIQPDSDEFVFSDDVQLPLLKHGSAANGFADVQPIKGYPEVLENKSFLAKILAKGTVPAAEYDISERKPGDMDGWNYILTQRDADAFMEQFAGFHDSTLEKVTYRESEECAAVNAVFDNRCWFGVAELCFEGVQLLKILPAPENYSREIFEASLIVADESVFWADSAMESPDCAYEGSIIKALSLKWRKI